MTGLGLGTETFLVSVLVLVPVRPKMSGLEKVSVSPESRSWTPGLKSAETSVHWWHLHTRNAAVSLLLQR